MYPLIILRTPLIKTLFSNWQATFGPMARGESKGNKTTRAYPVPPLTWIAQTFSRSVHLSRMLDVALFPDLRGCCACSVESNTRSGVCVAEAFAAQV